MTAPSPYPAANPVAVVGGPGGITVNRDAVRHLAHVFHDGAGGVGIEWWTVSRARQQLPDAGPFGPCADLTGVDPSGYLAALALVDQGLGDLQRAGDCAGDLAHKLRSAADGYPWGMSPLDVGFAPVNGVLATLGEHLPLPGPRVIAGHGSLAGGGDGRVAGWDPRVVDLGVDVVDLPFLAAAAAPPSDGRGVPVSTGRAWVAPPRSLADLVSGLGDVDARGEPGGIDVRILDGPAGRRVVVDITGTRTFLPGGRDVADLTTNTLALTGHDSAYERGVLAAMRRAGVRHDDHVMLVGHSLGGMIAVNTARDACRTGEFTVTHVVTAGSPVGLTVGQLPDRVRVLALENPRDVVPRLDSVPNPDRPHVTTVYGPHGDGTVGGNHGIDGAYLPLAVDTGASTTRSVRDFLDSADGFFRATGADAHSFRVERR